MDQEKPGGIATLPADLQQNLAAMSAMHLAQWLRTMTGGTVVIACTVPGVRADTGQDTMIVVPCGDVPAAVLMLPRIQETILEYGKAYSEALKEKEAEKQAAEKGN